MQQQQRPKQLTDLYEINDVRARALQYYGIDSPEHVAAASQYQLAQVDGISEAHAGRLKQNTDHIDPHPAIQIPIEDEQRQGGSIELWLVRGFSAALYLVLAVSAAATATSVFALAGVFAGAFIPVFLLHLGIARVVCG